MSGHQHDVGRLDYVFLSGWQGTPFRGTFERLRQDDRWHVHELPTRHNAMREAPDALIAILFESLPVAAS